MDFENDFWTLVEHHGSVAYFHRNECEDLWSTLTTEQQQKMCAAIQRKLDAGLFVHYDPAKAMRDNIPKAPKIQIISSDEYYRRFGTQTNQNGWVRTFLPEQQKTIYVKQLLN